MRTGTQIVYLYFGAGNMLRRICMKKKIFATITALLMLVSVFASVPAVLADDSEIGGLDFYSITLHYNQEILINYYETSIKVKNDKGKTVTQDVKYFYNTDAETEEGKYLGKKDIAMKSDKLVIPAGVKSGGTFYQLSTTDGTVKNGLHYSKFPYANAFITHIVDSSILRTMGKIDLFGITAPYDDAPYEHQNPNVQYADDGYALANEKDSNGNQLKIDVNGYLIDTADSIWRTASNDRIELYTAVPVIRKTGEVKGKTPVTLVVESEEMEWVPFADRFDENGKIINIKNKGYQYMITQEEYDAFLADESQTSMKLRRAESSEAYDDAPTKGKMLSYVKTVRVDSTKDKDTYFSTDRVFTESDIVKDEKGFVVLGTPRIGTPVLNISIKDITVEIDALGTQLYEDPASDPQQKNVITVSINDCEANANLHKKWFEEGVYTQEDYDEMVTYVLGSAKSVTTRTEINTTKSDYKDAAEYGYSPTVKSISLGVSEELLAKIPKNAAIYLNFHISEQQPEAAFDAAYQKKFLSLDSSKQSTLLTEYVTLLTEADRPTPKATDTGSEGFPTWAIIAIIAGAVVIVAGVVIIIFITGKKKKSGTGSEDKKENENK